MSRAQALCAAYAPTRLSWTLRQLGLRETSTDAPVPDPLRADQAQAVEAAIERAHEIDRQVRDQAPARVAFPWRFGDGNGIGPVAHVRRVDC